MTSERSKQIDTGAGFYLDKDDYIEEKKKEQIIVETPRRKNFNIKISSDLNLINP